ncbi:Uncharacterised protein [Nocardia otitidiscaviarum]|uniref:DUF7159 domain-containing protein n=1 Tax=Nocardia otitidiscaviarum TaxID=1823 RepID=A0A378YKV6_9NOCA|nr:hypothetical protein [Nocardia otitidiscaviarum]MBF6240988.1 hypothetical protein [Nocardia otitidiscaviarum]SUA77806.1 Uncharacterised protein [Nocardia otitidiscaviarum]
MTIGVSTERGTVHAVALADDGDKLPERVLLHLTGRVGGETKADLAAAVEAVMDAVADKIGPDRDVVGAAVAYRDAAERRAIVTRLASGRWHEASLVSAKSSHLAAARAMTWVDEFEDLAICEVVPGFQAFSLIDGDRTRVLAAVSLSGGAATEEAMRAAVTAAWDQFDAAGVRPDAVVLIGSAASEPTVVAALEAGFGAPIIPCAVAAQAPAIGAALAALPETEYAGEAAERMKRTRGTAALFAAASVLAGGLVAGGVYSASGSSRTVPEPMLTDARINADGGHRGPHPAIADSGSAVGSSNETHWEPAVVEPSEAGAVLEGEPAAEPTVVTLDPGTSSWGSEADSEPLGLMGPKPLLDAPAERETGVGQQSIIPAPTNPVGAPDGFGLFPGESAPPPLGTPEFQSWWDSHWAMMLKWAVQMLPRV